MNKLAVIAVVLLSVYIGYQFVDRFDPESVKGKNVVITGASTGIGEQLAYQYARLGANVVITARREQRLKEVTKNCRKEGREDGQYHYIVLDMQKKESTKQLVEFAEVKLDGIDVLILNHVLYQYGPWLGTPENLTEFQSTMDINLYAYVSAASYAIPSLEKSKGSIIILSTVAGKVPNPHLAPYSTAKHALEGFFGSLRDEFIMSKKDISISICTIGLIDTENALNMLKDLGAAEKILSSTSRVTPSDAALGIIKGGSQRWQRVYYPYSGTKPIVILHSLFPETLASLIRDTYEPAKDENLF